MEEEIPKTFINQILNNKEFLQLINKLLNTDKETGFCQNQQRKKSSSNIGNEGQQFKHMAMKKKQKKQKKNSGQNEEQHFKQFLQQMESKTSQNPSSSNNDQQNLLTEKQLQKELIKFNETFSKIVTENLYQFLQKNKQSQILENVFKVCNYQFSIGGLDIIYQENQKNSNEIEIEEKKETQQIFKLKQKQNVFEFINDTVFYTFYDTILAFQIFGFQSNINNEFPQQLTDIYLQFSIITKEKIQNLISQISEYEVSTQKAINFQQQLKYILNNYLFMVYNLKNITSEILNNNELNNNDQQLQQVLTLLYETFVLLAEQFKICNQKGIKLNSKQKRIKQILKYSQLEITLALIFYSQKNSYNFYNVKQINKINSEQILENENNQNAELNQSQIQEQGMINFEKINKDIIECLGCKRNQKFQAYSCNTCKLKENQYICENCIQLCHKNHDVYMKGNVRSGCYCYKQKKQQRINRNKNENNQEDQHSFNFMNPDLKLYLGMHPNQNQKQTQNNHKCLLSENSKKQIKQDKNVDQHQSIFEKNLFGRKNMYDSLDSLDSSDQSIGKIESPSKITQQKTEEQNQEGEIKRQISDDSMFDDEKISFQKRIIKPNYMSSSSKLEQEKDFLSYLDDEMDEEDEDILMEYKNNLQLQEQKSQKLLSIQSSISNKLQQQTSNIFKEIKPDHHKLQDIIQQSKQQLKQNQQNLEDQDIIKSFYNDESLSVQIDRPQSNTHNFGLQNQISDKQIVVLQKNEKLIKIIGEKNQYQFINYLTDLTQESIKLSELNSKRKKKYLKRRQENVAINNLQKSPKNNQTQKKPTINQVPDLLNNFEYFMKNQIIDENYQFPYESEPLIPNFENLVNSNKKEELKQKKDNDNETKEYDDSDDEYFYYSDNDEDIEQLENQNLEEDDLDISCEKSDIEIEETMLNEKDLLIEYQKFCQNLGNEPLKITFNNNQCQFLANLIFQHQPFDTSVQKPGEDQLIYEKHTGFQLPYAIFRQPIAYNGQNYIAVTSGYTIQFLKKNDLILKALKSKLGQSAHSFQIHRRDMNFYITRIEFSTKTKNYFFVSGFNKIVLASIEPNGEIKTQSNPFKINHEFFDKIQWLPNSDSHVIYSCMQHKNFRIFQLSKSGKSNHSQELKMAEDSGVLRDFCVVENPNQQEQYWLFTICSYGNIWMQKFNIKKTEKIIISKKINISNDQKGGASPTPLGISFSVDSRILTISFNNGINLFGHLCDDLITFKNGKTLRLSQIENLNEQPNSQRFVQERGDLIVGQQEVFVNTNQIINFCHLKNKNYRNTVGMNQGYMAMYTVDQSTKQCNFQILGPNTDKVYEEFNYSLGFCIIKDKNNIISVNLQENGSLNCYILPDYKSNTEQKHKEKIDFNQLLEYYKNQCNSENNEETQKISKIQEFSENSDFHMMDSMNKNELDILSQHKSEKIQQFLKREKEELLGLNYIKNNSRLGLMKKQSIDSIDQLETQSIQLLQQLCYNSITQPSVQEQQVLSNNMKQNSHRINCIHNNIRFSINDEYSNYRGIISDQRQVQTFNNQPTLNICLQNNSQQYVIKGLVINLEMKPQTGTGIQSLQIFKRTINLSNTTHSKFKQVIVGLSELEIIYSHLKMELNFTITTTNIKNHPIKIQSLELYGEPVREFQLEQKINKLYNLMGLGNSNNKTDQEEQSKTKDTNIDVQKYFENTLQIKQVNLQKRNDFLKQKIDKQRVRDLLNALDVMTYSLLASNILQGIIPIIHTRKSSHLDCISTQKDQDANTFQEQTFDNSNTKLNNKEQLSQDQIINLQQISEKIIGIVSYLKSIMVDDEIDIFIQNSAKRAIKTSLFIYKQLQNHINPSIQHENSIQLGHPYDYYTFKDLGRIQWIQKRGKQGKIDNMQELNIYIKNIDKLAQKRLPNLFYIFSKYPQIIDILLNDFFNILDKLKTKNQLNVDSNMEQMLSLLVKLIVLYQQFLVNRSIYQILRKNKKKYTDFTKLSELMDYVSQQTKNTSNDQSKKSYLKQNIDNYASQLLIGIIIKLSSYNQIKILENKFGINIQNLIVVIFKNYYDLQIQEEKQNTIKEFEYNLNPYYIEKPSKKKKSNKKEENSHLKNPLSSIDTLSSDDENNSDDDNDPHGQKMGNIIKSSPNFNKQRTQNNNNMEFLDNQMQSNLLQIQEDIPRQNIKKRKSSHIFKYSGDQNSSQTNEQEQIKRLDDYEEQLKREMTSNLNNQNEEEDEYDDFLQNQNNENNLELQDDELDEEEDDEEENQIQGLGGQNYGDFQDLDEEAQLRMAMEISLKEEQQKIQEQMNQAEDPDADKIELENDKQDSQKDQIQKDDINNNNNNNNNNNKNNSSFEQEKEQEEQKKQEEEQKSINDLDLQNQIEIEKQTEDSQNFELQKVMIIKSGVLKQFIRTIVYNIVKKGKIFSRYNNYTQSKQDIINDVQEKNNQCVIVINEIYLLYQLIRMHSQQSQKLQTDFDQEISQIICDGFIALLKQINFQSKDFLTNDKHQIQFYYIFAISQILSDKQYDSKNNLRESSNSLEAFKKSFAKIANSYQVSMLAQIMEAQQALFQRFKRNQGSIIHQLQGGEFEPSQFWIQKQKPNQMELIEELTFQNLFKLQNQIALNTLEIQKMADQFYLIFFLQTSYFLISNRQNEALFTEPQQYPLIIDGVQLEKEEIQDLKQQEISMQTFLCQITVQSFSKYIIQFIPSVNSFYPQNLARKCLIELVGKSIEKANLVSDLQGFKYQFEILIQILKITLGDQKLNQFLQKQEVFHIENNDIKYDYLLRMSKSLRTLIQIAQERPLNWVYFINQYPQFLLILHSIVFSQIRECLIFSMDLITLYYKDHQIKLRVPDNYSQDKIKSKFENHIENEELKEKYGTLSKIKEKIEEFNQLSNEQKSEIIAFYVSPEILKPHSLGQNNKTNNYIIQLMFSDFDNFTTEQILEILEDPVQRIQEAQKIIQELNEK